MILSFSPECLHDTSSLIILNDTFINYLTKLKTKKTPGSESLSSNSSLDVTVTALGAWIITTTTEPQQHSTQPSFPRIFKWSFKTKEASTALRNTQRQHLVGRYTRHFMMASCHGSKTMNID